MVGHIAQHNIQEMTLFLFMRTLFEFIWQFRSTYEGIVLLDKVNVMLVFFEGANIDHRHI